MNARRPPRTQNAHRAKAIRRKQYRALSEVSAAD
ncbi:hypothetical protein BJ970_006963 [Saccharopolyspora phatthalungensis]|uniref:Uncharacterized protein n=1 Tax=Saccharopolyspora phatthalungensis TaxID=664693 RepID=A0A840QEX0_9PSEU|nr:hypothetical protein [Saccharopolyspora phatthalungensis]